MSNGTITDRRCCCSGLDKDTAAPPQLVSDKETKTKRRWIKTHLNFSSVPGACGKCCRIIKLSAERCEMWIVFSAPRQMFSGLNYKQSAARHGSKSSNGMVTADTKWDRWFNKRRPKSLLCYGSNFGRYCVSAAHGRSFADATFNLN